MIPGTVVTEVARLALRIDNRSYGSPVRYRGSEFIEMDETSEVIQCCCFSTASVLWRICVVKQICFDDCIG